jgi:hypothetical protein
MINSRAQPGGSETIWGNTGISNSTLDYPHYIHHPAATVKYVTRHYNSSKRHSYLFVLDGFADLLRSDVTFGLVGLVLMLVLFLQETDTPEGESQAVA